LVPVFNWLTAEVLWASGRNDEAIAILKSLPPTYLTRGSLAKVYASTGHYGEAADTLPTIPSGLFLPGAVEEAASLLRSAPAQTTSSQTSLSAGYLGFVYLYIGAPNRALDYYEGLAEAGYPALGNTLGSLWAPPFAPIRNTARFKTYVRKIGLVDYWRAKGGDLCHPVGADDFACE
jgi:hypothetical protein